MPPEIYYPGDGATDVPPGYAVFFGYASDPPVSAILVPDGGDPINLEVLTSDSDEYWITELIVLEASTSYVLAVTDSLSDTAVVSFVTDVPVSRLVAITFPPNGLRMNAKHVVSHGTISEPFVSAVATIGAVNHNGSLVHNTGGRFIVRWRDLDAQINGDTAATLTVTDEDNVPDSRNVTLF